jgi:hypothetical protein
MVRQEFLSEMQAKLEAFDAQMAQLASRPKAQSERARQEREKTYFFLKARRDELRERLKQAESASEDGWNKFKVSVEKIYTDMVQTMDEACNRIDGPEHAGLY